MASMTDALALMVFTDLDGTLLDHESYRWDAALPALEALAARGCGVVLASSKTAAEIAPLRAELGLTDWPAIVENGAGLLAAGAAAGGVPGPYGKLRAALDAVDPDLRGQFRGFGDMSDAEVADLTGLSQEGAARARRRVYSEPGIWRGTHAARDAFLSALGAHGVIGQEGGRFLTLSFGATKADRVRELLKAYRPRHSVALGDAPNDIEMLSTTEFGVIVANPHRPSLPPQDGEATGRIWRTKEAGPSGWNMAMLALLDRLKL